MGYFVGIRRRTEQRRRVVRKLPYNSNAFIRTRNCHTLNPWNSRCQAVYNEAIPASKVNPSVPECRTLEPESAKGGIFGLTTLSRDVMGTWEDKEWGSAFLNMPAMQNVTRLLIERNPWDHLDIDVPHPTGFNPRSDADTFLWQNYVRTCNRRTLFSFVGATRGPGHDCINGNSAILEAFLDSDFCLQPRGDSYTRRSVFDCMVAGSIPLFFLGENGL
uniref:Exostosin GT47 domain-containing protein n=1 Tax=Manihot esculenta TaxID=3983 RepID=A0A2C9UIK5_MANES